MKIGVFLRINSCESPRFALQIAGSSKNPYPLIKGSLRGASIKGAEHLFYSDLEGPAPLIKGVKVHPLN